MRAVLPLHVVLKLQSRVHIHDHRSRPAALFSPVDDAVRAAQSSWLQSCKVLQTAAHLCRIQLNTAPTA